MNYKLLYPLVLIILIIIQSGIPLSADTLEESKSDILLIGNVLPEKLYPHLSQDLQQRIHMVSVSLLDTSPETLKPQMEALVPAQPAMVVLAFDLRDSALKEKITDAFLNTRFLVKFWQQKASILWVTSPPPSLEIQTLDQTLKQTYASMDTLLMNHEVFTLDLYDYIHIRRSDMFHGDGRGLSPEAWALCGDVVGGRILELLQEGEDTTLPYVLIMGDSISNGYNVPVRDQLLGLANVRHLGSGFTCPPNWDAIFRRVDRLVNTQGKPFDVIHVNWGLHALKFVQAGGSLGTPKEDSRCVPLEAYQRHLETLLTGLQARGDTVIWASSTPEHGVPWALPGDVQTYNEVATSTARKLDIPVNTLDENISEDHFVRPGDCHFNAAGSTRLGNAVSEIIRDVLEKESGVSSP